MKDKVCFLIPNFNQLHYLKNLINWLEWYHPDREQYPIYVLDNNSSYEPLIRYYDYISTQGIKVFGFKENDCAGNLKTFINTDIVSEWYCICDPDILPVPNTPHNYLDYFKAAIEQGYHHAGFDLITEDLPDWLEKRESIIYDENLCRQVPIEINGVKGFKGALDTTFALFKKSNGGWYAPMNGKDWSNAARLFKCFHFKFYIDPNSLNPELENYFKTATFRDFTSGISAGKNYFRPEKFYK